MSNKGARRILFAASECFPLLKTGGLADVVGALPLALMAQGLDVRALLPAFPKVLKEAKSVKEIGALPDLFGGPARLLNAKSSTGLKLFLLDAPHLFDIEGNPYLDEKGEDRADNHIRYAAFSKAAALLAMGRITDWKADVVHAHDWQTGLTAAYLSIEDGPKPKTVFTIHNLAFQGLFSKAHLAKLQIPRHLFTQDGLEYWDKIAFLKAGIVYSDHVTTVSPSYAAEIATEDGGMGLGGLLKSLGPKLSGIVNGIDTNVWNPETDTVIEATYSHRKMAAKASNKQALQRELGLKVDAKPPLFCVVSRLTDQKGLDLLLDAVPHIVGNGAQLAVLGSGDKVLEAGFTEASKVHKGSVGTIIGYDETLSHRMQAGADVILIPSRFEPCGLTQLCAMRYGTLPLVARVGGLADTVVDANIAALQFGAGTGFQFSPVTQDGLRAAIDRAIDLFDDKTAWRRLMRNAMTYDVSWQDPAKAYVAIYDEILAG